MAGIIDLSTIGVRFGYRIENIPGVRPTMEYIDIPGVKSIPSFNIEPAAHQSTTLNETQFHTYVRGLMDVGGAMSFTFNLTEALMDTWEDLVTTSRSAAASGRYTWFHVNVPGLSRGFFFAGDPSELGMPEMGVDEVLETEVFITPVAIHGMDTRASILVGPIVN